MTSFTIFVLEFITGGGFLGQKLPESLKTEGLLMRDALITDVLESPEFTVITTHDNRVVPTNNVHSIGIGLDDDVMNVWQQAMMQADYVWIIAPETDDTLYNLTEMAFKLNKTVIGCGLHAIHIASSKLRTYQYFLHDGITLIPSYTNKELTTDAIKASDQWIIKPDDGAGCEDAYLYTADELTEICLKLNVIKQNLVIQPYCEGVAASISVFSYGSAFLLLGCNTQIVTQIDGRLKYQGGVVNGAIKHKHLMEDLVNKILNALPDLQGYWGVDVIISQNDPKTLTMVEINPRLTTTYTRLKESTGTNVATWILNTYRHKTFTLPQMNDKEVAFYV